MSDILRSARGRNANCIVEAVEDLMIGVERGTNRRIAETFVQREVDGGEKRAFGSLTGGCINSARMSRRRSCCFSLSAKTKVR